MTARTRLALSGARSRNGRPLARDARPSGCRPRSVWPVRVGPRRSDAAAGERASLAAHQSRSVRARGGSSVRRATDRRGGCRAAGVRRDHGMGGPALARRRLVRRQARRRGGPGHAGADGQLVRRPAGHRDQRGATTTRRRSSRTVGSGPRTRRTPLLFEIRHARTDAEALSSADMAAYDDLVSRAELAVLVARSPGWDRHRPGSDRGRPDGSRTRGRRQRCGCGGSG